MNSPMMILARRIALLALVVPGVVGCEQVDVTAVPIARLEVAPPSTVVGVGRTVKLSAVVLSDQDEPLSNRAIVWHSENEDIAEVDADGQVTGKSPGTVAIRAESEGVSGTGSVQVTSSPAIAAAPVAVEFSSVQGGASPGDRTITLTNAGQGTLTGLTASVKYGSGQPTGWLSANLSGGEAPATLVLSAASSGLAAGTYTAAVEVTSAVAANSPFTVPVTFTVLAPSPAIGLSATTVAMQAAQGGSAVTQTVALTNAGAGTLSGLTSSITYESGQPSGWLSASLSATTAPATLTLTATPGALQAGTYTATVRIASGVAQNSPQTIRVTLTVGAASPVLAATPSQLSFTAAQGGSSPSARTVEITNVGGGSLTGLGVAVTYPGDQPAGWVTTSLNRTTAPATLTVGVQPGGLTAGTYNATIRVSSPVASSPVLINVTLEVGTAAPAIVLDRSSVSFTAAALSGSPPPQTVQVTNGGGGTLSGLAVSVVGQNTGWLKAELGSTTAPTTLTLTATRGLLLPGTYSATVRVTSSTAGNSPVDLPVTFTVALGTPQQPTSLSATAVSDSRINLAWTDNSSNEATFEIQRRTSGQDWASIGSTGVNERSFADSGGLSANTEYEYRVRACNAVGCSDWSDTAKAKTHTWEPNLTATPLSPTEVQLGWNASSGSTTYDVQRRSGGGGGPWTFSVAVPGGTTTYKDTGLSSGSKYQYRVRACVGDKCSQFSEAVEVTTTGG